MNDGNPSFPPPAPPPDAARAHPAGSGGHAEESGASHRALRMLSRCNEALIRSSDESALLQRICELAVDPGGYRMAWAGFAVGGEQRIVPAACAGVEDGFLAELPRESPADADTGPVARAVRSGEAVITTDLAAEPGFAPWLAAALARGYRGQVALPLNAAGSCFGVLVLMLPEPRQLPPGEISLLQEMADNLAFGIVTLRSHALRRRTYDGVQAMAQVLSRPADAEFFDALAQGMAGALELHAVLMARPVDGATVRTFCAVVDGGRVADFEFSLAGTPFAATPDAADTWVIPHDAARHFPPGHPVLALGVEACAGATLRDNAGGMLACMLLLLRRRLVQPDFLKSMLTLAAVRTRSEIIRREAHERLVQQATLLDNAQDAIMVRDLGHHVLYWNKGAERLYGWTAEEAVGRHITGLMVREPRVLDAAMAILMDSGEWKGELDHFTRGGSPLTVEAHWTLVRDESGRPARILAINTDVTRRKQALRHVERLNADLEQRVLLRTRQIEEANRELEAFSYSVSHDLRAPLNTIDGFSMILSRNAATRLDERGQHYLSRIRNGVREMSELIEALLELSRITRMKPQREDVDLSSLAREVAGGIAEDFRQRDPDHAVDLTVQPGMRAVGDARMLRQVLANLLGNAWKFTGRKEGPRVEMGTEPGAGPDTGASTVFFVRDNGAGFDMAYAERLFGAFQRLHPEREYAGTGIGLATVQRIVSLHGGRVWAQAEPGRGATFYFTLPVPDDATPDNRAA